MSNDPAHYLLEKLGSKIEELADRSGLPLGAEQVLQMFKLVDSTVNKSLLDWITKRWLEQKLLWEDLKAGKDSKVSNTLRHFIENFRKLEPSLRNIYQYKELGEVYEVIKPFIADQSEVISSKEIKRRQRERAVNESVILHRDPNLIISVPLSEYASCWWGRGTQWCTAAKNENMFHYYNLKGPLIIFTFPNGLDGDEPEDGRIKARKFQLHLQEGQFMNENDQTLYAGFIVKHWKTFKPIIEWAATQNPYFSTFIPIEMQAEEFLLQNLANVHSNYFENETIYNSLKKEFIQKLIDRAIECNHSLLPQIPKEYWEEQQKQKAIDVNPFLFDHLGVQPTQELAQKWIAINGGVIQFLPEEILTEEMCLLAIGHTSKSAGINEIPDHFLTREFLIKALEKDGLQIRFIHDQKMLDNGIIQTAVAQNGRALSYIKSEHWTEELMLAALESNPEVIINISANPKFIINPKLLSEQVWEKMKEYPTLFCRYMRSEFITQEIVNKAMEENGDYLQYIHPQWRTAEAIIAAAKSAKNSNQFIRELNELDYDNNTLIEVCKTKGSILIKMASSDPDRITKEMIQHAVLSSPQICFSPRIITKMIDLGKTKSDGENNTDFYHSMVLQAVLKQPELACYINHTITTPEFYLKLLENKEASRFVPSKHWVAAGIEPPHIELDWNKDVLDRLAQVDWKVWENKEDKEIYESNSSYSN